MSEWELLAHGKVSMTWKLGTHLGVWQVPGWLQTVGGSVPGGWGLWWADPWEFCKREEPNGEWDPMNAEWAWPATEAPCGGWGWVAGGLFSPGLEFRLLTLAPDEIIYIVNQWVLWRSHWLRVWHPPNLCYPPTQNALCYLKACFRRRQESLTSVESQTLCLELHSCYLVWSSPQPNEVSIILPILRWGN